MSRGGSHGKADVRLLSDGEPHGDIPDMGDTLLRRRHAENLHDESGQSLVTDFILTRCLAA